MSFHTTMHTITSFSQMADMSMYSAGTLFMDIWAKSICSGLNKIVPRYLGAYIPSGFYTEGSRLLQKER